MTSFERLRLAWVAAAVALTSATIATFGLAPDWPLIVAVAVGIIAADTVHARRTRPARPAETTDDASPHQAGTHSPMTDAASAGTGGDGRIAAASLLPLLSYCSDGSTRQRPCPRCGRHDLDAAQAGSAFAYQCRRCGHCWTWLEHTPWPITVPRPRLGAQPPSRHDVPPGVTPHP